MPLFAENAAGYSTDRRHLLTAAHWCKTHPHGRITTGMWEDPDWTTAEFWRWFMRCLHAKINRQDQRTWRKLSDEYQLAQALDALVIRGYYGHRIRHTGCRGLLRTPELRRRYPHIDRQEE